MTTGEKIKSILDDLNMNAGEFANSMDEDRVKFYKLLNNTQKPGYDTVKTIFSKYRQYSLDWFMLDVGEMKRKTAVEEESKSKDDIIKMQKDEIDFLRRQIESMIGLIQNTTPTTTPQQ